MISVALQLEVSDQQRHFALDIEFTCAAPVVALYGPSGGGKSLTLQTMAGLLRARAGHVRIDGRTLFDSSASIDLPAAQRRVGYLFQDYALFPHLSVRDNVAFGLTSWRHRLSAADAARVEKLLQDFGLQTFAHSRPALLSGGQRQRVALARALACQPQVLMLDEPFAALNPMLRSQLRRELASVRAQWGIPLVMITHDVDDVLALADHALLIEQGRVVRGIDVHQAEGRKQLQALAYA